MSSSNTSQDYHKQNLLTRLRTRLAARTDSEHETSYNRFGIHALVTLCAMLVDVMGWQPDYSLAKTLVPYFLVTFAISLLIFAHIVIWPKENPARRYVAIVFDTFCITITMHIGGEYYLWMYPFLLWAIFGNGFRFGVKTLMIASIIGVIGFALLMTYSPFWHRYPALSWGCLAGLITLPAYVSILIRKLEAAKRQAEESNRAKSAFLASISHELRTPLTAIIGLSDLMRATTLNRDQADMCETIGESGRSLLSLINAILDLSRLEVGKMPKKEQSIDLYRLFHRVTDMITVPAQLKQTRIALHFASNVPRHVTSYLKQIEDAIVNLASNAVKFTDAGHVLINVTAGNSAAGQFRLRVEVSDTGIGIAKEAQGRIFERFTQADETIIDTFGGTGLGLATVKQMIEDIGGQVGVTSAPGQGSTFWFEIEVRKSSEESSSDWRPSAMVAVTSDLKIIRMLEELNLEVAQFESLAGAAEFMLHVRQQERMAPLAIVDVRTAGSDHAAVAHTLCAGSKEFMPKLIAVLDDQAGHATTYSPLDFATALNRPLTAADLSRALVAAAGPRASFTIDEQKGTQKERFTVLLADDNKVNRAVISKILTRAGHSVEAVENGQLAIEALQEKHYDIALFDLNMPVMNGIEAAKLYQFTSVGSDKTPIVALTADATPEAEARCRDAGMLACLNKPIEASELLSRIRKIVMANGGARQVSGQDNSAGLVSGAEPPAAFDDHAGAPDDHGDMVIDTRAMDDLRTLGGHEFAQEVVEHFVNEATEVLEALDRAVADGDYLLFRDQLHALRSGAANVGATRVFNLCLTWRAIEPEELAKCGDQYFRELSDALVECSTQLSMHIQALSAASESQTGTPIRKAS